MAKAKSYKLQGREWTVKTLAEELGLSTPRVHGLLKEHNEDIKAIFASRGITPKPADKGPKARLFDYKGKQWTVKQLAKEFGLSNVRVNRLIKEFDGDIEKIALSREKSKKTAETKKSPKTDKTDEKTEIVTEDFSLRERLVLDLEDKVSFEGIKIDQSITDLYITHPFNLTDISALASLKNLQKLSLPDCYELTDISALASLNNLQKLSLPNCYELTDIRALASLENLEKLHLYSCHNLTDISALASLNNLKELRLGGERLKGIRALASLENLKELHLDGCKKLRDISALSSLKSLKELHFNGCEKLRDISALSSLKSLKVLDLNFCDELTDISALASLENLEKLHLNFCDELTDISALASLNNLKELNLRSCKKITDISALASLQNLEKLHLNVERLKDISALASLKKLDELDLSRCYELTDISALASLKNLNVLNLNYCGKLTDISAIDILKSLTNTEILIDKESKKAYEENLANLVDKKREELEIKLHLDDEVFSVKEKSSEELLDTMKNYIKKIHQKDKNLGAAEGFLIFNDLNEENHLLGIELINEDSAEFNYTFDIYSVDFHKLINDIIGEVGDYLLAANNAVIANDDSAMLKIFDRILGHKKIISIKNEVVLGIRHPNFNNIEEEEYTEIAIDYDDPLNSILDSQNWDSLSYLRPDAVMSSLQFGFKDSVGNTVTCYDFDLEEEELDHFDKDVFSSLISSKDINPTLLGVEHSCGSTITEIAKSKFIFEWEE